MAEKGKRVGTRVEGTGEKDKAKGEIAKADRTSPKDFVYLG